MINFIKAAILVIAAVPAFMFGVSRPQVTAYKAMTSQHSLTIAMKIAPNLCGYETTTCPD